MAQLNFECDLLLVGGGGLIHGQHKWMFKMANGLVSRVAAPMIFYGLGYNAFIGENHINESVQQNIRLLQAHALSFSVRNDGSRQQLLDLGIDLPEVPDPGFFVDEEYPKPSIPQPYVVLQLANDMRRYRQIDEVSLLQHVSRAVDRLTQLGYTVVIAPHVRADDALTKPLIDRVRNAEKVQGWNLSYYLRDENTKEGLSVYSHAHFVIAMRGHGQICPIGMGIPVVSIGSHNKNLGLLKKLGLTDNYVSVSEPNLGERLIEQIEFMDSHASSKRSHYRDIMKGLTLQTQQYAEQLSAKLDGVLETKPLRTSPRSRTLGTRIRNRIIRALEDM